MTNTTNATVEARHIAAADKVHTAAVRDELAQALANLEAARAENERLTGILADMNNSDIIAKTMAENADLTNRLAEMASCADQLERAVTLIPENMRPETRKARSMIDAALASGHTKTPCPPESCKDCAAMRADLVEIDGLLTNAPDSPSVIADAKAVAAPYRTPPADPLAEALKALIAKHGIEMSEAGFDAMLAWHKSRLEGAKWSRLGGAK